MRITALAVVAILVASACGDKPRPNGPFILTDRSSLGWGLEFASAVYVGTSTLQSLSVSNEGLSELKISDIVQSGDSVFSFKLPGQPMGQPPSSVLPLTVPPAMSTFIQFAFEPTDPQRYSGSIVIKSNADNVKELTIGLSGCALRKSADGGAPEGPPDGGC